MAPRIVFNRLDIVNHVVSANGATQVLTDDSRRRHDRLDVAEHDVVTRVREHGRGKTRDWK